LRFSVALRAPWFWDEGYVVEAAQSLSHAQRAQVSGLWEDGFFPLSTSILAPLTAAPWWRGAGQGRAAGCAGLGLAAAGSGDLVVGLVGLAFGRARFGIWRGGHLRGHVLQRGPWWPAFYHHLAVAFLLAALLEGLALFQEPRPKAGTLARASLWSGLAVAVAYWLWWLPVTWAALLLWKRPQGWAKALPWLALAPACVLGLALARTRPAPPGACAVCLGPAMFPRRRTGGVLESHRADLMACPFWPWPVGSGLAARLKRGAWLWLALLGRWPHWSRYASAGTSAASPIPSNWRRPWRPWARPG